MHKILRLTAWASPRAFARKTRPDGHAVKQVVCENLCMGAYVGNTLVAILQKAKNVTFRFTPQVAL